MKTPTNWPLLSALRGRNFAYSRSFRRTWGFGVKMRSFVTLSGIVSSISLSQSEMLEHEELYIVCDNIGKSTFLHPRGGETFSPLASMFCWNDFQIIWYLPMIRESLLQNSLNRAWGRGYLSIMSSLETEPHVGLLYPIGLLQIVMGLWAFGPLDPLLGFWIVLSGIGTLIVAIKIGY